ncbi:MAG: hypothetical protein H8D65_00560 [Spirochaetes bacterium]|nr:hypothetical protein [Spirochaetota bacterium]MBL7007265.1 hypothetical protein [Spirochaetia bacterium]
MKREDFVFCIGYQGDSAVIDGQSKKEFGKLDTKALAEKGLFRAAFCSAVYSGNTAEMQIVLNAFNSSAGTNLTRTEDMKRLLGVFEVEEDIKKSIVV